MANYSLILKLIADSKQFKTGFDAANKALGEHQSKLETTGASYKKLQQGLLKLNDVARNAALQFGTQSKQFKEATAAARAYQKQIDRVNTAMNKEGIGQSRNDNSLLEGVTGVALKRILPLMILNQIGKAFAATTKTIMEFNAQLSVLEAVSGESTASMKQFADSAIKIASVTPVTTREVVQLQIELAKLGLTKVQILAATEAIVNMSIAGMIPLGQAAEIAASTMKAFGLRANDIARIADVMATSFNVSAMDIERFSTSMALVSPAAKAAGYTIEFTTSALSVLVDRGMDASIAGTSLRNIFMELSKEGLNLGKVMDEIKNSVDPLATALKYFETRTASAAVLLATNTEELQKFAVAMYDAEGAASKMANTISDNLTGDLKELAGAWEAMTLRISSANSGLGKFIRDATQNITELVRVADKAAAGREGRALMQGEGTYQSAVDDAESAAAKIKQSWDDVIVDYVKGLDKKELFTKETQQTILEAQEQSYQDQMDAQIKALSREIAYQEEVLAAREALRKKEAEDMTAWTAAKSALGIKLGINITGVQENEADIIATTEALRLMNEQIKMLIESKKKATADSLMNAFIPEGDGGGGSNKTKTVLQDRVKYTRELTGAIEILQHRIAITTELMNQDPRTELIEGYKIHIRQLGIELHALTMDMEKFPPVVDAATAALERMAQDESDAALQDRVESYKNLLNNMKESTEQFAVDMLAMGISDIFEKMANKDSQALDNYGWKILQSFGKFLVQMGSMIIAYGTAQAALTMSKNPLAMIAAGVAMVAIGAAMSGFAKGNLDKAASGGSVGSATGSSSVSKQSCPIMEGFSRYAASDSGGSTWSSSQKSGDVIPVEFIIKGDALVGVLKKNGIKQSAIG